MGSGVSQTTSSRPSWPWPSDGPPPASCRRWPSSSVAIPVVRAPSCRPRSRPAWPPRGPTSSTSGCCPRPGWPTWPSAGAFPAPWSRPRTTPSATTGSSSSAPLGTKLAVEAEAEVERELESILEDPDRPPRRPTGRGVGRIIVDPDAVDLYRDHLLAATDGGTLDGLRHRGRLRQRCRQRRRPRGAGRARRHASPSLHDDPDGININDKCGSTDPGELWPAR